MSPDRCTSWRMAFAVRFQSRWNVFAGTASRRASAARASFVDAPRNAADAGKSVVCPAASVWRLDIDDRAAAQCSIEVFVSQDEAVADLYVRRFRQDDVCGGIRAGFDRRGVQQADPPLAVAGGGIDVDRGPVTHRAWKVAPGPLAPPLCVR